MQQTCHLAFYFLIAPYPTPIHPPTLVPSRFCTPPFYFRCQELAARERRRERLENEQRERRTRLDGIRAQRERMFSHLAGMAGPNMASLGLADEVSFLCSSLCASPP